MQAWGSEIIGVFPNRIVYLKNSLPVSAFDMPDRVASIRGQGGGKGGGYH